MRLGLDRGGGNKGRKGTEKSLHFYKKEALEEGGKAECSSSILSKHSSKKVTCEGHLEESPGKRGSKRVSLLGYTKQPQKKIGGQSQSPLWPGTRTRKLPIFSRFKSEKKAAMEGERDRTASSGGRLFGAKGEKHPKRGKG